MTAGETFDVVVLGGGTGGYSCALRAADHERAIRS